MALLTRDRELSAQGSGRAWVWAADVLGLCLATSLIANAAGAPALGHAAAWLIAVVPMAGFALAIAGGQQESASATVPPVVKTRSIMITPEMRIRPREVNSDK